MARCQAHGPVGSAELRERQLMLPVAWLDNHAMEPANNLAEYYARRAAEYEKIFAKPERQPDLACLRALLPGLFAGRDVLEVACGTGYWTQIISGSARSILATDINEEVLEIARHKTYPNHNVAFQIADA